MRGGKAGTARAVPARHSLGGDRIAVVVRPCGVLGIGGVGRFRLLFRQPRGFRRPHQRGQPAGCDHQLLGGLRHVLLLHIFHPLSGLDADSFTHGGKNVRLGDPTEIGPRGRSPMRGHIERHGFRQPVRCHRPGPALRRQFYSVDRQCDAMGEQRHAAVMV